MLQGTAFCFSRYCLHVFYVRLPFYFSCGSGVWINHPGLVVSSPLAKRQYVKLWNENELVCFGHLLRSYQAEWSKTPILLSVYSNILTWPGSKVKPYGERIVVGMSFFFGNPYFSLLWFVNVTASGNQFNQYRATTEKRILSTFRSQSYLQSSLKFWGLGHLKLWFYNPPPHFTETHTNLHTHAKGPEGNYELLENTAFANGADTLHPTGFSPNPSTEFLPLMRRRCSLSSPRYLPANTCVSCLCLPIHCDHEYFRRNNVF